MSGVLRTLLLLLACGMFAPATHAASVACRKPWPAWDVFKKNFISKDGRVVDGRTDVMQTTSEGQAYALFFALVANDQATFEQLLNWTVNNLADGDLASHLPAWSWGKTIGGMWGVLDANSASDADLWIAYALGEAGRLWDERRYVALSSIVADRILAQETRNVPELGLVLLPGISGFEEGDRRVRLNPSYVPLQLMRWFSVHSEDPRWKSLLASSQRLIEDTAPEGYAPDWADYDYERGFLRGGDDPKTAVGSYDAIRVYLWAGMLDSGDSNYRSLLDRLKPMAKYVAHQGYPPESVVVATGAASAQGSSGFSAAVLPLLQAEGLNAAVGQQLQRIVAQPLAEHAYYDQVLGLYGLGWHDKLYRFDSKGNLTPRWISPCQ